MNLNNKKPIAWNLTLMGLILAGILAIPSLSHAEQVTHSYDELNRLTKSDYGNGKVIDYSYDAAGNRLTQQVKVDQPPVSSLVLQTPNGAEIWNEGSKQIITWKSQSTDAKKNLLIYLTTDNGLNWKKITSSKNTGFKIWTIPVKRYITKQALIKICFNQKILLCDTSNAVFTINKAPVAEAGIKQTVTVGTTVVLNGGSSYDADNGPSAITYNWVKKSGPAATLTGENTATPSFTPTIKGIYVFGLVVNDGSANSGQDKVTVTVKVAPANTKGTYSSASVWSPLIETDALSSWQNCDGLACIIANMKRFGANETSIDFVRKLNGEGYLSAFEEKGRVDIGTVEFPSRANTNEAYVLLNGIPALVSTELNWDDLNKGVGEFPTYSGLKNQYPNIEAWPASASFISMTESSNSEQRFIYSYNLLNGCHACGVLGKANVAFDFSGNGAFKGTKVLGIIPANH